MRHHCGQALARADKDVLAILFSHLLNSDQPAWEFTFDTYALQPNYRGQHAKKSSGSGGIGMRLLCRSPGRLPF